MQEQLGLNIVLFKIKNTDFDFTPYGLTDRYFRIDVTDNINASKSIKFTEYPLIDGTTRIDTVSRAPGTLNFLGKIGDVFSSPDYTHTIKSSGGKTRMQLSIELLETLRDNAIVLDVLTQSKTFENYLIETVNFTTEEFGVNTVNFSLREFIAFGDDLSDIVETVEPDETSVAEHQVNTLGTNNFTTDREMINEIYRLVTHPDISPSFVIKFGSLDINPDVFIKPIQIDNLPYIESERLSSVGYLSQSNFTYYPSTVSQDLDMQVLTSGIVKDNLKIKLEIDKISTGSFTEKDSIVLENRLKYQVQEFVEIPKYNVRVQMFKRSEGEDKPLHPPINLEDVMVSPRFTNVDKCFNPYESTPTIDNDPITTYGFTPGHYHAINFLRKYNKGWLGGIHYKAVPNLLQNSDQGYMYPIFYYSKVLSAISGSNRGTKETLYLNIGFVYLHPAFANKIKERFIEDAEKYNDHLLRKKEIIWW